jgi:hypothetical protein
MNITQKLVADLVIVGIFCGLYLQYRGFRTMQTIPATAERGDRTITREEALKLVASLGYVLMGAWYEALSVSQAVFS